MRHIRRLRTLSIDDIATLAESVVYAAAVEIAIRVVPIATVLNMIERDRGRRLHSVAGTRVDRLAWFASAPYRLRSQAPNCLRHSLVLCALLRRRGAAARVCFGVDRSASAFAAHAWVVVAEGEPAAPPTPFSELPRAWSA